MSEEVLNQSAQGMIKSVVDRLERLEAERAEIAAQIKEVMAEAKGNGLSPKILRKAVQLRKMEPAKRQEDEALLDLYMGACQSIPLFEKADAGSSVSVTFGLPGGSTITAPIEVVGEVLNEMKGDDAALYAEAKALVIRDRTPSCSYIQRRLQIGYNKAARFIEQMEGEGIVGKPDHLGKRPVLVSVLEEA